MSKKRYADLHVRVSCEGDTPELLIKMAKHLGFNLIALSIESPNGLKDLEHFRKLGKSLGLDVATRLDLKTSDPDELKYYLRKFRRKVEITAVYCNSITIARVAARDRRVDVTFYNPKNLPSVLDEGQISLLAESGHHVEVNLLDMLYEPPDKQVEILRNYKYTLGGIRKKNIPIVFSSGASRIIDMRAPRELSSIAFMILNDENLARDAVSTVPLSLINTNREKLSSNYVQPGIRVVNEW
ncbi:MAG: hypothetical protein N3F04_03645 [Candidatus Nezhaarchaeota archaeon]|nr:hypothetical protein [Candidatus Nezhaarchaeota archaeon]MCX8141858.1 hypothetical protein [Candidatus Nezhaarchaeota archaeon]MDW8050361.1 RNase P subunit p30 family protein [Nitrososphaerota archaeon]